MFLSADRRKKDSFSMVTDEIAVITILQGWADVLGGSQKEHRKRSVITDVIVYGSVFIPGTVSGT